MADWCFVQDNTRPYFAIQILKEIDDQPVDLTGYAFAMYFKQVDNPDPKVNGSACIVTDAANGKVEYRWVAGDLADPGEYVAEFRGTNGAAIQSVIIEGVIVQEKQG